MWTERVVHHKRAGSFRWTGETISTGQRWKNGSGLVHSSTKAIGQESAAVNVNSIRLGSGPPSPYPIRRRSSASLAAGCRGFLWYLRPFNARVFSHPYICSRLPYSYFRDEGDI